MAYEMCIRDRYEDTQIIDYGNGEVHMASHDYGKGRGVYIAGLPYSLSLIHICKLFQIKHHHLPENLNMVFLHQDDYRWISSHLETDHTLTIKHLLFFS